VNQQVSQRMRDAFRFGSKAETLERLAEFLPPGRLCDQIYFTSSDWEADRQLVLTGVVRRFAGLDLVVRSSALSEDGALESRAGAYLSCVGVECRESAVETAVDRVLASYENAAPGDQVLIQPQVQDVAISGVVMTRELDTGAPYYVINYDDFSGRTDGVTSGAISKVVLVHRSRPDALTSERMRNLVGCIQSIEDVTGSDRLDIEFCIDGAGRIFILQVRPLAASNKWTHVPDADIDTRIDDVRKKLADYSADPKRQDVLGSDSIFGNMPDWNPAEMIGSTPRPLAYSLYEKLVTRESWAAARSTMGYRDLTGHPLMVSFAEQPFIDVRLSLNSFLPASVSDEMGEKLVEYQLAKLSAHPEFHDKIEFAIAIPSADFTLPRKIDELREAGFDAGDLEDFQRNLTDLTIDIVDNGLEAMRRDEAKIESLKDLLEASAEPGDLAAAIALLDRCAAEGVVPFARLARHGFVGVSFLKSLQETGLLEPGQADLFLTSVRTIANEIVLDMNSVAEGELSAEEFLGRYGHLRPGTYDITSPRYDHDPAHYLGGSRPGLANIAPFQMTPEQGRSISDALAEFGFRSSAEGLLEYIAEAIRLRELAKFRFTRVLSHCIESIAAWGEAHELDRELLSFLSLSDLTTIEPGALKSKAEQARRQFDIDRNVRLPHLIRGIEDVDVIRVPLNEPSYITQERVSGPVADLSTSEINSNIDGHIVLIESADPGFDWIFSHDIKALLTKYGGANSHMAIRCAEFRVPAAIGCGDRLYDMVAAASIVEINCGARTIKGNER
jgi:glutamine kinase